MNEKAQDVMKGVASRMPAMNEAVEAAQELVDFLDEVGDDTTQAKLKLEAAKLKRDKWSKALETRGLL